MSMSSDDEEYGDDYEDDYSVNFDQAEDNTEESTDQECKLNSRSNSPQESRTEDKAMINDDHGIPHIKKSSSSQGAHTKPEGVVTPKKEISQVKKISNNQNPISPSIFHDNTTASVKHLQHQLLETSRMVVSEGERNVSLSLDLVKIRDEMNQVKQENDDLRQTLLRLVNNDVSNKIKKYMNIPLKELLRLCLQEFRDKVPSDSNISVGGGRNYDHIQSIRITTKAEEQKDKKPEGSNSDLEHEIQILREKLAKTMTTSRREREIKLKHERGISAANQRIEALSEHIEKLMVHLKHEATSKAKALRECSRCRKEIELLTKRNGTIEKSNLRKERALDELKESTKILEDQLAMMDDKYMELRMKLDWTRSQTERVIKTKEEEIKDLRAKLLNVQQDLIVCQNSKKKIKPKPESGRKYEKERNKSPLRKMSPLTMINVHKLPSSDDIT